MLLHLHYLAQHSTRHLPADQVISHQVKHTGLPKSLAKHTHSEKKANAHLGSMPRFSTAVPIQNNMWRLGSSRQPRLGLQQGSMLPCLRASTRTVSSDLQLQAEAELHLVLRPAAAV